MEYSSKQSQEKRRGFIDPRTKLALVLILALFVMGGLGGEQMQPLKMILSAGVRVRPAVGNALSSSSALIFCAILRRNPDTLCGDHHDGRVCHRNYIGQ